MAATKPRTPEFKRSARVLVQAGVQHDPSDHKPSFVPRRRSFGIVVKPFDPLRSPARARRSRSRENLNGSSRNSSRHGSRNSSIGSLTSLLSRRKSRSMGDFDLEDDFIVENEVQHHKVQRKQSVRDVSSSPRRRSLSRSSSTNSRDTSGSRERSRSKSLSNLTEDHKITKEKPPSRQRKRSKEFSVPYLKSNLKSNEKTDSSSSASTVQVSFKMGNGDVLSNSSPQEDRDLNRRSRYSQYEVVQQKRRAEPTQLQSSSKLPRISQQFTTSAEVHSGAAVTRNATSRKNVNEQLERATVQQLNKDLFNTPQVNSIFQNSSGTNSYNQSLHQEELVELHHSNIGTNKQHVVNTEHIHGNIRNTPRRVLVGHTSSESSDEGSTTDEQPWARREDSLLQPPLLSLGHHLKADLNEKVMNTLGQDGNQSRDGSQTKQTDYININDSSKPLLPPRNPPKLAPKICTFSPENNAIHQFNGHAMLNQENIMPGHPSVLPPVPPPVPPPKSLSARLQVDRLRKNNNKLLWNSPSNCNMQQNICSHQMHPSYCSPPQMANNHAAAAWQTSHMKGRQHIDGVPAPCWHCQQMTPGCPDQSWALPVTENINFDSNVRSHEQRPEKFDLTRQFQATENESSPSRRQSQPTSGRSNANPPFHRQFSTSDEQHWQVNGFKQNIDPVHFSKAPRRDVAQIPHWDTRVPIENTALIRAQRQFKSTANFKSAGFLQGHKVSNKIKEDKLQRARSTDALTVHGFLTEDPEFDNRDISSKIKKAKSNIVLDDISLGSSDEEKDNNKPRLSHEKKRGKLEMWSGVLHLLTMCSSLLTTVTMAIVTTNWDRFAHKCPLFVESNLAHDRFWGNSNKIPCYMSAFLPLVVVTISLVLVFIHGALLFFWRSNRKSSSYYMKKSFGVTVTFANFVAFGTALTVACILTDGLRQTCLSFMLISDMAYRPATCQAGLSGLDLNYRITGTFYYIVFGIIGSWLSVVFTATLLIMYMIRAGCCTCRVR